MAEPVIPPGPSGPPKPGQANPKQRRMLIAGGVGLALALVFLLRGRGGGAGGQEETEGTGGEPPFGSTFADNGEAAGALSTSITDALAGVLSGQADLADSFYGFADALYNQPAGGEGVAPITINTGPGPAGVIGSPAKKVAVKKAKAPAKRVGGGVQTLGVALPPKKSGGGGGARQVVVTGWSTPVGNSRVVVRNNTVIGGYARAPSMPGLKAGSIQNIR